MVRVGFDWRKILVVMCVEVQKKSGEKKRAPSFGPKRRAEEYLAVQQELS